MTASIGEGGQSGGEDAEADAPGSDDEERDDSGEAVDVEAAPPLGGPAAPGEGACDAGRPAGGAVDAGGEAVTTGGWTGGEAGADDC